MKTTLHILLAIIVMTLTISASPVLIVETTITEHHAKGGKDILMAPRLIVDSGKQATVLVGNLEYAITSTLLDNGTVDLQTILTEHNGMKTDKLTTPRIKTKLGQVAEIKIGQLAFTTKTTLAK